MTLSLPTLENECFFIGPIGAEGSDERGRSDGVLDFIVSKAAGELGLTAVRADRLADPGQITLQVIEHVLGAQAAVADLTGRNPNVFYELAIRHTARLPVVLIAEQGEELPFDIAQMRVISFDHRDLRSADKCRESIVAQTRQALEGAVDSPIAASVDLKNLQAGSAVERQIAELVETVDGMATDLGRIRTTMDTASHEDKVVPSGPQETLSKTLSLRMNDDSMLAYGISRGDVLLIDPRDYASHGDIVVLTANDRIMVRTLVLESGGARFVSADSAEEPIEDDEEKIQLLGVASAVRDRRGKVRRLPAKGDGDRLSRRP
jgi:hypothetical protein